MFISRLEKNGFGNIHHDYAYYVYEEKDGNDLDMRFLLLVYSSNKFSDKGIDPEITFCLAADAFCLQSVLLREHSCSEDVIIRGGKSCLIIVGTEVFPYELFGK